MYRGFDHVVLATGERVDVGVVRGPDAEWAERVETLLCHKGDPWNWQNHRVLTTEVGIESWFYLLHRGGIPFANCMIAERAGVGMLAHVWTNPQDRGKGACSALMRVLTDDFRSRQGRALFLFTRFDSVAYHIYQRFGFGSVEPQSGFMDWYATSSEAFEAAYWKKGTTEIQPVRWAHWPSSLALCMGDSPGVVRCVPLKLIGRQSSQRPFLPLLREEERRQAVGEAPQALVLHNEETTAVVGFTAWDWHPLWDDTCLVDVYCHTNYWDKARNLLASLALPEADRYLAYSDIGCQEKIRVLVEEGFRQTAVFTRRVPSTSAKTAFLDVALFEK
jgi:hypothetical protein